jgi:hypothetical protein
VNHRGIADARARFVTEGLAIVTLIRFHLGVSDGWRNSSQQRSVKTKYEFGFVSKLPGAAQLAEELKTGRHECAFSAVAGASRPLYR